MLSPERSLLRDGVASVLLYMLLLEWLRPLLDMSEWSGVYEISPFMIAFGLFVAVDWLRLSPWLAWPVKVAVCIGMVVILFDAASPGLHGLLRYAELTKKDAVALADQDYGAISPDNRTMLFLLGWSMMITVFYALVVERGTALWFVAATLLYLLGLQLWPGLNTSGAIVRTVWFGFLLTGLQQLSRLEHRFSLRRRGAGWPLAWLVSVPLLLASAVAAGLWLPPAAPSGAMRPLDTSLLAERFAAWGGGDFGTDAPGSGTASAARTGYGGDDTLLGGPVRLDDAVAFTAMTEKLTYWRGEAKTFYTGKGWEAGGATDETDSPLPQRAILQEVTVVDPSLAGRLFAGGPVTKIEELVTRSGKSLSPVDSVVNVHGVYMLAEPDAKDPLRRYMLRVSVPEDEGSATGAKPQQASVEEAGTAANGSGEPADAAASAETEPQRGKFAPELQLPAGLPVRVKVLAETVALTGSSTSDYDRAKAIEAYLRTNYRYKLDVAAPPKEMEDFADTFLFESKEGYCDYFSTSMVVMLRSIGIPARWVKGFSSGEVTDWAGTGGGDAGLTQVTVHNRNAHSWVEAYIAGSGWTTFDPTPGNTLSASGGSSGAESVFASAQPSGALSAPVKPDSSAGWAGSLMQWKQKARERLTPAWLSSGEYGPRQLWPAAALLLAFSLVLWGVYRLVRARDGSAEGSLSLRYAAGDRAGAYRALDKLWRALFRRLGRKQPSSTVREYVESLPLAEIGKRDALLDFVKQYEAVRYGGEPLPRSAKRNLKELWRKIKSR
ncbi:DUF4129 domain-containing transglutaminase family protein [Paenibacillus ginsengarvi]|uniref:DUF4129 domain-containing protein n=1 Tax=Paenibacillus ginsengarvi TaxID=400777 RepID=A0A3B0BFV2_9BACL|nr:transglutaminase domain-containing protein [Paenibacillus ginsengarvi]RKN71189.1 DUF4129 domain-containing protein [Paenibacillus ginsengarvi]